MSPQDEIASVNQRHWEKMVKAGCGFTRPWLDLDRALVRRYAGGQLESPPEPLIQIYPVSVLADVGGKDVLCLASGGGQQSAVFGLLGARVTVVDLAEGQLHADRKAAAHYGYDLAAIRADMRDLSCLGDESFDLVYGGGMCYVPDVRPVYSEVARLLRTGGAYRVDFTNPATEFVDCDDWDGRGYRITRPYAERIRRPAGEGEGPIEFRHYLADIFNALLAAGMSIQEVREAPHCRQQHPQARPGSWAHWLTYVTTFAIVARKAPK